MAHVRFSKQLDNYQSQLNDSATRLENRLDYKMDYRLDEDISMIKIKEVSFKGHDHKYGRELAALLNEGEKLIRQGNFSRAEECFR